MSATHSRPKRVLSRPGGVRRVTWLLALATLVVGVLGWLSLSGRIADLRYANVPYLHPFPPSGMEINPFTNDPRDLIGAATAHRVLAEFERDGAIETDALSHGDLTLLVQGETGRALARARQVIEQHNAAGEVETTDNRDRAVFAGVLADPADPAIRWCAEEDGDSTIRFVARSTGVVIQTQRVRFRSRYWLVPSGDRYLIADAWVTTQPLR